MWVRERERERETLMCCSTQPRIHWLILVCALLVSGAGLGRCVSDLGIQYEDFDLGFLFPVQRHSFRLCCIPHARSSVFYSFLKLRSFLLGCIGNHLCRVGEGIWHLIAFKRDFQGIFLVLDPPSCVSPGVFRCRQSLRLLGVMQRKLGIFLASLTVGLGCYFV